MALILSERRSNINKYSTSLRQQSWFALLIRATVSFATGLNVTQTQSSRVWFQKLADVNRWETECPIAVAELLYATLKELPYYHFANDEFVSNIGLFSSTRAGGSLSDHD